MALPPWWTPDLPDLVSRRDSMPCVERWQTAYVRYKTQPEAAATHGGWELANSRRFAEKLAAEDGGFAEDTLLYNGLAPTRVTLQIVDAPAEYAVPVKQDRRLTPNFKVRVGVEFRDRCSFPLTLKAYIISQAEKDGVPEWVPEDFLDPDAPPRKPITELKGNVCVTHNFDAAAEDHPLPAHYPRPASSGGAPASSGDAPSTAALASQLSAVYGLPADAAAAAASKLAAADPGAAAAASAWANGTTAPPPLDQLLASAGGGAGGVGAANGLLTHDFEFCGVELLKPTRMNKAYLVFACSVLEQDLMFVVYNIPTVGICRAEQRVKACQKLGINYADLAHVEHMYVPPAVAQTAGVVAPQLRSAPGSGGGGGEDDSEEDGSGGGARGGGAAARRKRTAAQQAAAGGDALIGAEGLAHAAQHLPPGAAAAGLLGAAAAVQQQQQMIDAMLAGMQGPGGMPGLAGAVPLLPGGVPVPGLAQPLLGGYGAAFGGPAGGAGSGGGAGPVPGSSAFAAAALAAGGAGGGASGAGGPLDVIPMSSLNVEAMLAEMDGMINAATAGGLNGGLARWQSGGGGGGGGAALPRGRMALREMILEAYEGSGLSRKLTGQDLAALESQAGFPPEAGGGAGTSISEAQWREFEGQYHTVLQLLKQISSVWNLEDPCVIAGFDMDRQGTVNALRNEPAGTFICRFSMSQPGCLVLSCKGPGHPNADADGLVHAIIRIEDLLERRVDTWIRDFPGASHVLDVYKGKRVDKRKVFASNYTRLRALDALDDLDALLGPGGDVVMGGAHTAF